jgi:hypothetical protein
VFILDSLLIGSLRFVLDKVVQAAEAEAQDDSALRDQLLEAQMRLELGEITEEEFVAIERDVIAAIREIKRGQQGPISMSPQDKITGVDIESFEDETLTLFLRRQGRRRGKRRARRRELSPRPAAARRVLVVSTDPAHSLGDALGVKLSAQPRQVDAASPPSSSTRRARSHAGCGSIAARSARFSSTAPGSIARTSTRCSTCRSGRRRARRPDGDRALARTPSRDPVRPRRRRHGAHRAHAAAAGGAGRGGGRRGVLDLLQQEHRLIREQLARVGRPEAADALITLLAAQARETAERLR